MGFLSPYVERTPRRRGTAARAAARERLQRPRERAEPHPGGPPRQYGRYAPSPCEGGCENARQTDLALAPHCGSGVAERERGRALPWRNGRVAGATPCIKVVPHTDPCPQPQPSRHLAMGSGDGASGGGPVPTAAAVIGAAKRLSIGLF
eukprot:scaffold193318_cov25-Tisochrysis_lutea.AAC.1